jgi:hypothetical protein
MSHHDDIHGAGGLGDPRDVELVGLDEMVSAAMGGDFPHPVDWSALSAVERRDEACRLWPWVVELVRTWPVSRDVVPPCWYRHESLIRILSAARDAYLTAYHSSQAASAAADWMHVWDATEERLRRWVSRSGCKSGEHHPDRIQRWVADRDEAAGAANEFEAFVANDFDRRSAQELREAIHGQGLKGA